VGEGKSGRGLLASLAPALIAVVVAVAVVIAVLYARSPRATPVHVGQVAPDFTLTAVNGGIPIRLAANRNGPTLLVFFDVRRDGNESYFEHLQRMHMRYYARGLKTIAVSIAPDARPLTQFLSRTGATFPVLSDPFAAGVHKAGYGTPRDPEAYFLDGQGRVQAVFTQRIDWNTRAVADLIEKNLPSPAPGS
jgi:peroxiredoxin